MQKELQEIMQINSNRCVQLKYSKLSHLKISFLKIVITYYEHETYDFMNSRNA